MSGQEAYKVRPDEEQGHAEPIRLRLVKTAAAAPAPAGRERLDLRAYLPTPRNLRVLLTGVGEGTGVLVGRGWEWLRGEGWDSESAMKAGGTVFVCYAAGTAALEQWGTYTGYLIPPAVAVWCLVARQHTDLAVAVRTATREARDAEKARLLKEAKEKIAAAAKEAAAARFRGGPPGAPAAPVLQGDVLENDIEDEDEEPEGLTVEEIAAVVRRVAGRHPRHLGVHLSDLLPEPELQGWEQPDLKAALQDDWGLPVSSFKLTFPAGPARTREGVRLEHLPAAPAGPGGRGPAGAGEGLALVPSQHPAAGSPEHPAEHPAGARSAAPSGTSSGVAVSPSPSPAPAPSQGTR
ncbi:hypothetical protein OG892_39725 [Streptomyces sp. NBC_00341]|uniref:hypothetical protein n=1 Tax=Streptomyces sp. NBC_00341 TaxID=2975717 RepID=UPI003084B5AD|nr:hypothetical protein OG892_39725 [Streptomyces sp. NBC_00341]